MPLPQRKSPEERAINAARKEEERAIKAAVRTERESLERRDRARGEFWKSPAGQARVAFEGGDLVFQSAFNVMSQEAIIVKMAGSKTTQRTADPSEILNSVCREGWELVNGSFVFVEQGQQSRDKFLSSGQNVAVKGVVLGYYLFKRWEANLSELPDPWEVEFDEESKLAQTNGLTSSSPVLTPRQ